MHPIPFTFLTAAGYEWYSLEKWFEAFESAEILKRQIDAQNMEKSESQMAQIDEALHLYQLSLELQPVHPRARIAEEKILWLLQKKQDLSNDDLSEAIEAQQNRLKNYYPE